MAGFQLSKIRCRVHPAVILTMLDAHNRLKEGDDFAIGTLLGTISSEGGASAGATTSVSKARGAETVLGALPSALGSIFTNGRTATPVPTGPTVVVEIVDCFVNPYVWDGETQSLQIQREPHEWMLKLREKISPKLSVVGWCCTTSSIVIPLALNEWARLDSKLSRFAPSKALPEPVHILIDPTNLSLPRNSLLDKTKGYVKSPLRQLLYEIPLELSLNQADAVGVSAIVKASTGETGTADSLQDGTQVEVQDFEAALLKIQSLIKLCIQYTDQVLKGERKGDPSVGRLLTRSMSPHGILGTDQIEALCESVVQDNLMITYLTNLAHLQLAITEKLSTSLPW